MTVSGSSAIYSGRLQELVGSRQKRRMYISAVWIFIMLCYEIVYVYEIYVVI